MASLIRENVSECDVHFAKAEKLWSKEAVKTDSSLINIVGSANNDNLTASNSYLPYKLFKEYPQQGKWFWTLSRKNDAYMEFLLNCLTGFYMKE